jgi:hypothetical protein
MRLDGGTDSAPIDRPVLEYLRDRLAGTRQVRTAAITEDERLELRVEFADSFYPDPVITASLSIRWYTNDDFANHYREAREPESWECRWDRHPNPHNTREHFHPPPDASTPGEDASYPSDYRDVTSYVLSEIEQRIAILWDT